MELVFTFEEDLLAIITEDLRINNIAFDPQDSFNDILVNYLNLQNRLVEARPRRVHQSLELKNKTFSLEIENCIHKLIHKCQTGENLNAHLSTAIINVQSKHFYDALYDDWGIQHFHLDLPSGKAAKSPFSNRADPLLFTFIQPDDIYFIDLLGHESLCEPKLIEIIASNWPHLIKNNLLTGLMIDASPTAQQVKVARRKNFNLPMAISKDQPLSPLGGGRMSNGISMRCLLRMDSLRKKLSQIKENLILNETNIKNQIESQTTKPLEKMMFGLKLKKNRITVTEKNSGAIFNIELTY